MSPTRFLVTAAALAVIAPVAPAVAGPWVAGQQTPVYTDAHPRPAANSAPYYADNGGAEPADIPTDPAVISLWTGAGHTGSPPTVGGGNTAGSFFAPGTGSESKARFDCDVAGHNHDDPILAPGVPGGSTHGHTTFGDLAYANSMYDATYANLRTSQASNSTCYGGPLNLSLYWEPDVMVPLSNGAAVIKKPKNIVTYYESGALADIGTGKITDPLVNFRWPRNFDMIEGFNMLDPTNTRVNSIVSALNGAAGWAHYSTVGAVSAGGFIGWNCASVISGPTTALSLADSSGNATLNCTPGTDLYEELVSDPCWDMKNPTSPNGRLHTMPFIRDNNTGRTVCPDNWAKVTQFRAKVFFNQNGANDIKTWYFSSDRMPGMTQFLNGQSGHFDLRPAWGYGTAAAPEAFLIFQNHCDGVTITIGGTTLTGDAHECGYGRISATQNLYVNEASPDGSLPDPVVNLNPNQAGVLAYFPGDTGTPIPGTVHNSH